MRVRGVLAIALADARLLHTSGLRQRLDTITALAAIALERVHFVTVAQETLVKIESQRLRESLLAALSHDLRTPITTIAGIAESLSLEATVSSKRDELIAALRRQVHGMARLVTNILDMARFESGSEKSLRRDWQSLEELTGAARHALADVLAGRDVLVDIPVDFPLLCADGVLLERVLVNLLENASKYGPPDRPMGITARHEDGVAEVIVWDEGPGLPPGDPERLFSKFVRGDAESNVSGVGLGLAICRAIVEAHGGTITAQSTPDKGARFIIRLPLENMPTLEPEGGDESET
jgi:two-component system sensor histidine kinase KdpD